MSEEEIIKKIKELLYNPEFNYILLKDEEGFTTWHNVFEGLLNLYKQEKENNKELENEIERQINARMINEEFIEKNFISKDIIKEKIQELEKRYTEHCYFQYDKKEVLDICINELKELLEEK